MLETWLPLHCFELEVFNLSFRLVTDSCLPDPRDEALSEPGFRDGFRLPFAFVSKPFTGGWKNHGVTWTSKAAAGGLPGGSLFTQRQS